MNTETIKLIVEVISLLVIIISLVIAIQKLGKLNDQLHLVKQQHTDEFEWKKRESSLKYSGLFHPLIRESKHILQEEFNLYGRSDSIPKQELLDKMQNNVNVQIHINNLLTYYENISLSTQKGIADIDIIYDMVGKTMANLRKKLINYIDYHRDIAKNERLWKEFEHLATEFEKRGQNPSEKLRHIA